MSDGGDWLLVEEIKEAINEGVISETYCNYNEPSIFELKRRMKALDEIDVYIVIKTLVKHRRDLFVRILEYMNKREGEKNNADDSNI